MEHIRTISLPLPFRLGNVNCYLLETEAGFFLVDTGGSNGRARLEGELAKAGCTPGRLRLIILTHGDFDHTGSAAYFREKFGGRIAMHRDDAGIVERGDLFWNRSIGNPVFKLVTPTLFGFPKSSRFTADLYLEEGDDLSQYGLPARVISIPGHSKGSIGILTAQGDLFCGDMLVNSKRPSTNSIIDDLPVYQASLARLQGLEINTVYPGHGQPFPMALFLAQRPGTGEGA